jgi:hypothetical protein
MDFRLLSTKVIVVYNVDTFDDNLLHSNIKVLNKYTFQPNQTKRPDPGVLVLSNGKFVSENKEIFINEISIQPRKIIVNTNGFTEDTELVLKDLHQILIKNGILKPEGVLFKTYETISVIKEDYTMFDISRNSILSEMIAHLEKLSTDVNDNSKVDRSIYLNSLKFQIAYNDVENYYGERGLSLNPKDITIEKRFKTSPLEGYIFISTPYKWEEHQKIIEFLRSKSQK